LGAVVNSDDRILYWPGINPSAILSRTTLNLEISAVIGNGTQPCTLAVAGPPDLKNPYLGSRSEIEKHVFSVPNLLPKVRWTISQEGKVLSQFEETAGLVPVADPLAMAQWLGASRALTPLAAQLPRSMAAAVGFVDSTYSLVALEEDKLSAADAERFASAGVPDLSAADIKANPEDLLSLPVAQWLVENPPQRIWNFGNSSPYATRGGIEIFGGVVNDANKAVPVPDGGGQAGAFMPMPMAGEFYVASAGPYPDYTREISAGILTSQPKKALSRLARVVGRFLVLDLAALDSRRAGPVRVEIFDIAGSLLFSERFPSSAGQAGIEIPLSRISRHGGLCLMRLSSTPELKTQKLWLPAP
jgi:hypothetical protein